MILLPGDIFRIKKYVNVTKEIQEYLNMQLTEHQQTFNENNIRDYIDAFLYEMNRRTVEGTEQKHFFESKSFEKYQ